MCVKYVYFCQNMKLNAIQDYYGRDMEFLRTNLHQPKLLSQYKDYVKISRASFAILIKK